MECHARNTISANSANSIALPLSSVSWHLAQATTGRILIAGCVIDQAVPSKIPCMCEFLDTVAIHSPTHWRTIQCLRNSLAMAKLQCQVVAQKYPGLFSTTSIPLYTTRKCVFVSFLLHTAQPSVWHFSALVVLGVQAVAQTI